MTSDGSHGGAASTEAAFFDLDRTLMAGSSGFHWAREARRAGLISRRRLAADAFVNLRFRLEGSTDAATDKVRERVGAMIAGRRVRDLQRLSPRVQARQDAREDRVGVDRDRMADRAQHREVGLGVRVRPRLGEIEALRRGELGLMGVCVPEASGGAGADFLSYCLVLEELSRADAGVGVTVAVNPDAVLARVARAEGWAVMRFDTLGRRMKAGTAILLAALVGTAGRSAARRAGARVPPPRLRTLRR